MVKRKPDEPVLPEADYRMPLIEREYLLAACLTLPGLYLRAKQHLTVDLLSYPDEQHLQLAWILANRVVEECGTHDALFENRDGALRACVVELGKLGANHGSRYNPESLRKLYDGENGYLAEVFSCTPDAFIQEKFRQTLGRFLTERGVQDRLKLFVQGTEAVAVRNMPEILGDLASRANQYASVGYNVIAPAVTTAWRPSQQTKKSTGVAFLDERLNGGHGAGESINVLGAYGSGKTALAVQLATAISQAEQIEAMRDPSYEAGYAYYFHFEMTSDEIMGRFISHAGFLSYDRVMELSNPNFELSAFPEIETMDLRDAKSLGPLLAMPESRRMEYAIEKIRNTRVVNMAPVDNPKVGSGGHAEIESILHEEQANGCRPAVVILDYAGLMVSRQTEDKDRRYRLLQEFADRSKKLGERFQTPVWNFHQLNGVANSRSSSAVADYSDAEGCKGFSQNAHFSFELNKPFAKTGVRKLSMSKARRGRLFDQPALLKVVSSYTRLIDVTDNYTTDASGGLIAKGNITDNTPEGD